jgi:membrane protein implicated in regulation of membrane protease activity
MADSTVWWMLAGAVVALELLTGTFFLLMLGLGLAAGAVAAHAGTDVSMQLVVAALVGGGAIIGWQRWRSSHPMEKAECSRDVNLDIGQQVQVDDWRVDGTAKVRYRGADWEARLMPPPPPSPLLPGPCVIVAIEGSHLVLRPL